MLNKEEELKLEYLTRIIANSKEEGKFPPLSAYDIEWLVIKLKETNDICREYHLYKRPPMGILK